MNRGTLAAGAPDAPQPHGDAERDSAPDAEPALQDRERSPPGVRDLVPARGQMVEPPADEAGRETPERDLVDERGVAIPTAPGDDDRDDHRHRKEQPIDM